MIQEGSVTLHPTHVTVRKLTNYFKLSFFAVAQTHPILKSRRKI